MFITDGETKKAGKTEVTRITLTEKDGSETIINVTPEIHFLLGFVKTGENKVPMEILVYGVPQVLGEIFYQMGNSHPELVKYCFRRDAEKVAAKIVETIQKIEKSDVDPVAEALKKMPTPEDGKGWN